MIYDLQALGCKLTGNPADAAQNTIIFQQAIQSAKGGNPGPIELPMGVLAVQNGKLDLSGANMVFRGYGSMGARSDWGPTSTIKGFGQGDTLKVSQGGCKLQGLVWTSDGQQRGGDSYLRISETQVEVSDMHMDSPNVGITVQHKPGSFIGQSWIKNILMEGIFRTAGIVMDNGGGASLMSHVRTFNGTMQPSDPQPPYGILVRSAGELMMDSCDICNCGANLAVVPGIDGQANTFVQNLSIVNCDFDNGNGEGQVLIRPQGSSFVLNTQMTNVWCSSVNNGSGAWPANGLTIDGRRSRTATGIPSIMNVSVANSLFQNSVNHCGIYANTVTGLGINGCTAGGDNFVGFQTAFCTGVITACRAGAYVPPPLGSTMAGNRTYGILLEKSPMAFNPGDNALVGNGQPPGWKVIP